MGPDTAVLTSSAIGQVLGLNHGCEQINVEGIILQRPLNDSSQLISIGKLGPIIISLTVDQLLGATSPSESKYLTTLFILTLPSCLGEVNIPMGQSGFARPTSESPYCMAPI